mmetsp:Transcript_15369/g.13046  ORF Transcript_15369/g.13046 Transcript_15369/m.13046 type:complete len:82 (-) Transcript_15369:30-275(-)
MAHIKANDRRFISNTRGSMSTLEYHQNSMSCIMHCIEMKAISPQAAKGCNGTLVFQIVYYWNATKTANAKDEESKKTKKDE